MEGGGASLSRGGDGWKAGKKEDREGRMEGKEGGKVGNRRRKVIYIKKTNKKEIRKEKRKNTQT